jgi:hypothetical protein
MNEHDLRGEFHDTMTAAIAPPPMNEVAMLDAAKRAHRQRRARIAAAGAASLAAAVVVVASIVVTGPSAAPSAPVGSDPSTTHRPPPQPDGTQTAGPYYDKGLEMIDELVEATPPGLETPDHLMMADPEVMPLRWQSVDQRTVKGDKVWIYDIQIPVRRAGGTGEIHLSVVTAGSEWTGNGCASTLPHSGPADCHDLRVDGKVIARFTAPPDVDHGMETVPQDDSWVSYRYPDGTFVTIAQADDYGGTDLAPMAAQPLTQEQLVEMVTDPRFHLD